MSTTRQRTRRRAPWGLLVVVVGILAASVGPVPAAEEGPAVRTADGGVVYPMVFPLLGEHTLTDSFGDPRGRDRRHEGVDLLADRMVPVVAVADGVVRWIHDDRGGNCCDVAILHDDGWRSRYIHLNNDTPGTDDGRAVGIAPGVREGARVRAGQLIGWVGDSGNAESTVPHLHFELRRPDGTPVDPLPSLKAALRTGRELAPARPRPETRAGDGGAAGGEEEKRRGGLLGWLLGRGGDGGRGGDDPAEEEERAEAAREEAAREGREREEAAGAQRGAVEQDPPDGDGPDRGRVPAPPAEPEVVPAPPMPPEEGEPVRPAREDEGGTPLDGVAAPGFPAEEPVPVAEGRPGALPGLGMDRRVEEVPVDSPAGAGPPQERPGGWLSCFGFTSEGESEGETASYGPHPPEPLPSARERRTPTGR